MQSEKDSSQDDIAQIDHLQKSLLVASYLPRSVVHTSLEHAFADQADVEEFQGVLVLIDISGFTKMSEVMGESGATGLEIISKSLNSFFGQLVDIIDTYNGDVIKIAGDALIAVWRVENRLKKRRQSYKNRMMLANRVGSGSANRYRNEGMAAAVSSAVTCACQCVDLQRNYKLNDITARRKSRASIESGSLRLHCAISSGQLFSVLCGGMNGAWESVVCGDSVFEGLRRGLQFSLPGQVVVDKNTKSYYSLSVSALAGVQVNFMDIPQADDVFLVDSHSTAITRIKAERASLVASNLPPLHPATDNQPKDGKAMDSLKQWLSLLQVTNTDIEMMKKFLPTLVKTRIEMGIVEVHPELRSCVIIFICLGNISFTRAESITGLQDSFYCIQAVVHSSEGFIRQLVVDDKGCVVIATYGAPGMSHEDDPVRGVEAALQIYDNLSIMGIKCSIGCTYGRVYCGDVGGISRREYAFVGDRVNTAAHLMNKKDGILCEQALFDVTKSFIIYEAVPDVRLKGKESPVTVYRPLSSRRVMALESMELNGEPSLIEQTFSEGGPTIISLVGREVEVKLIEKTLSDFLSQKKCMRRRSITSEKMSYGKILVISGESGMGKSMIVNHLNQFALQQEATPIVCAPPATGNQSPFFVWGSFVHSILFGTGHKNSSEKIEILYHKCKEGTMKWKSEMTDQLDMTASLEDFISLLNPIMNLNCEESLMCQSLSADVKSHYIRLLLLHLFLAEAGQSQRIYIIEDVERMDSASWTLLFDIAGMEKDFFFVLSQNISGNGKNDENVEKMLQFKTQVIEIKLGPLTPSSTIELAAAHLRMSSLPKELETAILDRSQGNPFFISELCNTLVEKGVILVNENQEGRLNPDFHGDFPMPESIEALIVHRIDKLGTTCANLLKTASVFGMSFHINDLAEVHPKTGEKVSMMKYISNCARNQLLEVGSNPHTYTFKSRIVRDAVYNMILQTQKRNLHSIIARYFENKYRSMPSKAFALLAHHFNESEDFQKAADYAILAGRQSLVLFCIPEAIQHLNLAMDCMEELSTPVGHLNMITCRILLGKCHMEQGSYSVAGTMLQEALESAGYSLPSSDVLKVAMIFGGAIAELSGFLADSISCHQNATPTARPSIVQRQPPPASISILERHPTQGVMTSSNRSLIVVPGEISRPSSVSSSRQACSDMEQETTETAEGMTITKSQLALAAYELLAQIKFRYSSDLEMLYCVFQALRLLPSESAIGPKLTNYSYLAMVSAMKGYDRLSRLYIAKTNLAIEDEDIIGSNKSMASQAMRQLAVACLTLNEIDEAHGYCKLGQEYAKLSNDLQNQVKLRSIEGSILMIKAKPTDLMASMKKLRETAVSIGSARFQHVSLTFLILNWVRFGVGNKMEFGSKLQKSLKSSQMSEEPSWKLDRCHSSCAIALAGLNHLFVREVALVLCELEVFSPLIISAIIACMCSILRYLRLPKTEKEEMDACYGESIAQHVGPGSSKRGTLRGRLSGVVTGQGPMKEISILQQLLGRLAYCSRRFRYSIPVLQRYTAYVEYQQGKFDEAHRGLIRAYATAEEFGDVYEMAACSLELERLFHNAGTKGNGRLIIAPAAEILIKAGLGQHLSHMIQSSVLL